MANIQLCKSDRLLFKLLCCVLVQTGCRNARVDSCVDGCFSLSLQTSPAVCCCCPWAGAHPKLSRCPHRARGPAVSAPTSTRCSCWTSQKLWTAWVQISAACDFCLIFLPFFLGICVVYPWLFYSVAIISLLCITDLFEWWYPIGKNWDEEYWGDRTGLCTHSDSGEPFLKAAQFMGTADSCHNFSSAFTVF